MLRKSLLLFLFFSPWAEAASKKGCMVRHLKDAIQINFERKPIYSNSSNGQSDVISDELIAFEKSMLLKSYLADTLAWPYLKYYNVPFLCNDLQDMSLTPKIPTHLPLASKPKAVDFVDLKIDVAISDLKQAFYLGYPKIYQRAEYWLNQLEKETRLNCMSRHFLESIRAFARNLPNYIDQVPDENQLGFINFSKSVVLAQINDLKKAHDLDIKALKVQVEGTPILCMDVPPIP